MANLPMLHMNDRQLRLKATDDDAPAALRLQEAVRDGFTEVWFCLMDGLEKS